MPFQSDNVPPKERCLRSPLLTNAGFAHGFFTRCGGVSQGVFSSLNFTSSTGDSVENVDENLARAGSDLGIPGALLFFLSQVHGTHVVEIAANDVQREFVTHHGDIVVTRRSGAAAAIRTADCVPLLMGCRKTGWVAACHSGWRGCAAGAAIESVRALRDRGATDLVACIGPHISAAAFEVSSDVAEQLVGASPDPDIVDVSGPKPHVNLRKMVRSQLVEAGLAHERIDDVPGCTVSEPARFFSFRRDKNPSGRLLSAIVAP